MIKLPAAPWSKDLARLVPDAFSLAEGRPLRLSPGLETGYAVSEEAGGLRIAYHGVDDLMLALGDVLAGTVPPGGAKVPPFGFRGIMLDVSRNAAVRTDFLKDRIARLALLGLNRFCLYTEDTYPVPGEPLFGYARGRYALADLKDLAKHAGKFGVEMFPCIQTLGHMEHILKYPHYTPLKDNDFVYNVYADELYAFIEKTIDAAVNPTAANSSISAWTKPSAWAAASPSGRTKPSIPAPCTSSMCAGWRTSAAGRGCSR